MKLEDNISKLSRTFPDIDLWKIEEIYNFERKKLQENSTVKIYIDIFTYKTTYDKLKKGDYKCQENHLMNYVTNF